MGEKLEIEMFQVGALGGMGGVWRVLARIGCGDQGCAGKWAGEGALGCSGWRGLWSGVCNSP